MTHTENQILGALYLALNNARSAWRKGVCTYAIDLFCKAVEGFDYSNPERPDDYVTSFADLDDVLLNGADSWSTYSWGGCSLIYDGDIAALLCTPSELKKTRNGERRPNSREEWLDVQARALFQAARLVVDVVRGFAPAGVHTAAESPGPQ